MKFSRIDAAPTASPRLSARSRPLLLAAAALAAALLAAWLLLPTLTPAHLEGFTAALGALGLHVTQGSLPDFDRLRPLDVEYFGLTKLGAVLAIAGFVDLLHLSSDLAMRLMMWSGLAALVAGACLLARRWSGARWLFVLPLPLLLPGIVESAFVYDDNVLSAGLAALGLCLLYGRGTWSLAGAGLLLGFAILTRTDTILICATVPIILWERFGWSRKGFAACAVVAAAAVASFAGPLAFFHATPLDVLAVGSDAVSIWSRPTLGTAPLVVILYCLGVPGLLLVAAGAVSLAFRRDWLALARLTVAPLLLLVFLGDKLWQIRQLLALAPFLCALAAIGVKAIYEGSDAPWRRWIRPALAVAACLSLVGPVTGLRIQDGPRVLSGRVWTIPLWRAWQQAPRRDFATLDGLIGSAAPGRTRILIADEWNEDRYLHLRLLDAGFRVDDGATLAEPCRPLAERFTRGAAVIILLRLHHPFVAYWTDLKPERLGRWALPCVASVPAAQPYFVAAAGHVHALLPGLALPDMPRDDPRRDPLVAALSYGPIVAIPLRRELEAPLFAGYAREAAAQPSLGKSGGALQREADERTAARTRFGR